MKSKTSNNTLIREELEKRVKFFLDRKIANNNIKKMITNEKSKSRLQNKRSKNRRQAGNIPIDGGLIILQTNSGKFLFAHPDSCRFP